MASDGQTGGIDYAAVLAAERDRAFELFGPDELATALAPTERAYPAIGGAAALGVAGWWLGVARANILDLFESSNGRAGDYLFQIQLVAAFADYGAPLETVAMPETLARIRASSPETAALITALSDAFHAIATGDGSRVNERGVSILDAQATRQFWDAITRAAHGCTIAASAVPPTLLETLGNGVSVMADNLTGNIKAVFGIASDVGAGAADVAGDVLGKTAEVTGQVASNFVAGFGLVSTAVVVAGGYVAWRYVL